MKFHHDFHHQAYINNLNKAMAGKPTASLASLMPGAKGAKLNNAILAEEVHKYFSSCPSVCSISCQPNCM